MYYQNLCEQFKSNTKKLWNLINKVIGKLINKTSVVRCIKDSDIHHYTSKSISNAFGQYFANVGKNFADKIPVSSKSITEYINQIPNNPKSLFLSPTNELEIIRLISALPNKRSSGFDNVDNMLLKEFKFLLSEPLAILFNRSLQEGIFPNYMKLAEVVPLYKGKERNLTTNY